MAFMTPVVRKDWNVWAKAEVNQAKNRSTSNRPRADGQLSRSDEASLSTASSLGRGHLIHSRNGKPVPLSVEIRNQQHLRFAASSMPSGMQSSHLIGGVNNQSSKPRSLFQAMHGGYRVGNGQESPCSPVRTNNNNSSSSSQVNSPSKDGFHSSFQKFQHRLVDRLRHPLGSRNSLADAGETGTRRTSP